MVLMTVRLIIEWASGLPLQSSIIPMMTRIAMQISFAYVKASCMRTAALTLMQLTIVITAEIGIKICHLKIRLSNNNIVLLST